VPVTFGDMTELMSMAELRRRFEKFKNSTSKPGGIFKTFYSFLFISEKVPLEREG